MLNKIQIKRTLKDHCQTQLRKINKDLAIDAIAQELIEHEKEIIEKGNCIRYERPKKPTVIFLNRYGKN